MKESKRNFENRELTDDCFGVWKLERDDSYETPTIKHHENQHDEQERLGFEFGRESHLIERENGQGLKPRDSERKIYSGKFCN